MRSGHKQKTNVCKYLKNIKTDIITLTIASKTRRKNVSYGKSGKRSGIFRTGYVAGSVSCQLQLRILIEAE